MARKDRLLNSVLLNSLEENPWFEYYCMQYYLAGYDPVEIIFGKMGTSEITPAKETYMVAKAHLI